MNEFCYQARPEVPVHIPIAGSELYIKATLRGEWSQPLVIMVHGLASSGRHMLMFLGSRYLHELGFAVLRVNLYDLDPRTRNLKDCTLQTLADDVDTAAAYARSQGASQMFGIGHSYGGLTLLRGQAVWDGLALWDPSHPKATMLNLARFDRSSHIELPEQGVQVMLAGYGHLDSLAMITERAALAEKSVGWSHKNFPVLFVRAEKSKAATLTHEYIKVAGEHDVVTLPGARHSLLDSDETMLALFEETGEWLKERLI